MSSMCSGQEGQRTPVSETKWKEDSSNSRPGRESLRFVLCLPETYPGNYYSVISSSKVFFLPHYVLHGPVVPVGD